MDITRELPHSQDAEEGVLGSILINSKVYSRVANILRPDDFLVERNQLIFNACVELDNRYEALDITTIADELTREGNLERAGGIAYLNTLAQNCVTSLNAEDYARDVYRDSVNRKLIEAGNKIANVGYDNNHDISEAIGQAEEILFKVRNEKGSNDFVLLKNVLSELSEDEERRRNQEEGALERIPSGLIGLDKVTGGFQRTNLIVLGGRTSMGKTSLALNIAINVALQSHATVAFFSLEMSRQELATRLISSEAEVDSKKFVNLNFTEDEDARRMDAIGRLGGANIYIDDSSDSRISEIRSKARRLHSEHPLDLIIVDYLQFIKSDGKSENRVLELGTFSKALKSIARELNVPVIALAQLNRGAVENKRDQGSRYPQLTDIRESGNIEQDADVVIFVHRDSVIYRTEEEWAKTHPGDEYPREMANIIIAKNRNGGLGNIPVHFKPEYTKFDNLASANMPGYGQE